MQGANATPQGGDGGGREHARLEWRDPESEDRLVVDVVGDPAFLRDLAALGFRRQEAPGAGPTDGTGGRVRFAALERRPTVAGRLQPAAGERWPAQQARTNSEDRGGVRRKGA